MNGARRAASAAALAVAVVGATMAGAGPASSQTGSDWLMYGRDINNSRSNPTEQTLSPATVSGLAVDWTVTTSGDVSATPAVADSAVYIPDWGGGFRKVDAETGQVIWQRQVSEYAGTPADAISRTSPVVVDDTVYIGTQSGAVLLAIDIDTGDLRWNTPMDTHPDAILTSSASYYNGVIYQGVSSLEFLNAGNASYPCCTFRGSLVAVDAATGAVQWKTHTLPDQGPGNDIFSGASGLPDRRRHARGMPAGVERQGRDRGDGPDHR